MMKSRFDICLATSLHLLIAGVRILCAEEETNTSTFQPSWAEDLVDPLRESFVTVYQYNLDGEVAGTGSGFCIDEPGLIATCFHVVGEARRIGIVLPDGREVEPIAVHAWNRSVDLAILQIDQPLPPLRLAEESPKTGSPVAIMGNPGGHIGWMATGVVASLSEEFQYSNLLPMAMSIEQGNSGGPVVNEAGEVVGVVAMKDARYSSYGYAIPASILRDVVEFSTPRSFSDWTKTGGLSRLLWRPTKGHCWSQKSGRIIFRASSAEDDPCSVCESGIQAAETGSYTLTTEVLPSIPARAGLSFALGNRGEHFAWVIHGRSALLLKNTGKDAGDFEVVEQIRRTDDSGGDRLTGWDRLTVTVGGNDVRCSINGVEHFQFSPEEDTLAKIQSGKWGLHVSGGPSAEFRNAAVFYPEQDDHLTKKPEETSESEQEGNDPKSLLSQARKKDREADSLRARAAELQQQASLENISTFFETPTGFSSLTAAGLSMASLHDPSLEPAVYEFQLENMAQEVSVLLDTTSAETGDIVHAIGEVIRDRWKIDVLHEDDRASTRLLDDPRRLFEDREGGIVSNTCLYLDLARRSGLPHAKATAIPGILVCDATVENGNATYIHVCNGEFVESSELGTIGCLGTLDPETLASVKGGIEDRDLLMDWLQLQKDQVPMDQWPDKVVPYLETIVAIDPDAAASLAELALFEIHEGKSNSFRRPSFRKLLATRSGDLNKERMCLIFRFMGFDLSELIAGHP